MNVQHLSRHSPELAEGATADRTANTEYGILPFIKVVARHAALAPALRERFQIRRLIIRGFESYNSIRQSI